MEICDIRRISSMFFVYHKDEQYQEDLISISLWIHVV